MGVTGNLSQRRRSGHCQQLAPRYRVRGVPDKAGQATRLCRKAFGVRLRVLRNKKVDDLQCHETGGAVMSTFLLPSKPPNA